MNATASQRASPGSTGSSSTTAIGTETSKPRSQPRTFLAAPTRRRATDPPRAGRPGARLARPRPGGRSARRRRTRARGFREAGHRRPGRERVFTSASRCIRAAGRAEEADALLPRPSPAARRAVYDLPLHLVELGRGDEFLALTDGQPGHLWLEAEVGRCHGRSGGRVRDLRPDRRPLLRGVGGAARGRARRHVAARRGARLLRGAAGDAVRPALPRSDAGVCVGSGHARRALVHGGRSGQPPARGRSVRAARRLRARPAGHRAAGVSRPAPAEGAARHARAGRSRERRPRAALPREAGDPPLPRLDGRAGTRARGDRRGGVRRRRVPPLDGGSGRHRPPHAASPRCPASAR